MSGTAGNVLVNDSSARRVPCTLFVLMNLRSRASCCWGGPPALGENRRHLRGDGTEAQGDDSGAGSEEAEGGSEGRVARRDRGVQIVRRVQDARAQAADAAHAARAECCRRDQPREASQGVRGPPHGATAPIRLGSPYTQMLHRHRRWQDRPRATRHAAAVRQAQGARHGGRGRRRGKGVRVRPRAQAPVDPPLPAQHDGPRANALRRATA